METEFVGLDETKFNLSNSSSDDDFAPLTASLTRALGDAEGGIDKSEKPQLQHTEVSIHRHPRASPIPTAATTGEVHPRTLWGQEADGAMVLTMGGQPMTRTLADINRVMRAQHSESYRQTSAVKPPPKKSPPSAKPGSADHLPWPPRPAASSPPQVGQLLHSAASQMPSSALPGRQTKTPIKAPSGVRPTPQSSQYSAQQHDAAARAYYDYQMQQHHYHHRQWQEFMSYHARQSRPLTLPALPHTQETPQKSPLLPTSRPHPIQSEHPSTADRKAAPRNLAGFPRSRASMSVSPFETLRKSAPKDTPPVVSGKENASSKTSTAAKSPTGNPNPCHCKKSRCLKLYCECFSNKLYCDGCKCIDCQNTPRYDSIREKAMQEAMSKNKLAFGQTEGCKCRRSECLKKYCEVRYLAVFASAFNFIPFLIFVLTTYLDTTFTVFSSRGYLQRQMQMFRLYEQSGLSKTH